MKPTPTQIEAIAEYLKIRDEALGTPEADDDERLQSATDIAALSVPAAAVVGEADGWKLVPIEPTQEMIDEACSSDPHVILKYTKPEERGGSIPLIPMANWRAMIAAAPSAPEGWQPLYDDARLTEAEELARVMEAESNQMREISISNRHRAEAAQARLNEALAEVAEFKARYEAWRPITETPNETYILSGVLFDFYCEEPDADGEDSAFSLVATWDERPEKAVMWCRIVTPRWPNTEDFTSDRSLSGGRS